MKTPTLDPCSSCYAANVVYWIRCKAKRLWRWRCLACDASGTIPEEAK